MLSKTKPLLAMVLLITGCPLATDEEPIPQAPDPIGGELMRVEGTWALAACARSHLYREGREVQYQCFDTDGVFSWENRGMLTADAAMALDAELTAADLDDTDPVNYMGFCDAADAQGSVTMWIGERSVNFAPFCLLEGIVGLYDEVSAVRTDVSDCQEPFQRLESVAAGCRAY